MMSTTREYGSQWFKDLRQQPAYLQWIFEFLGTGLKRVLRFPYWSTKLVICAMGVLFGSKLCEYSLCSLFDQASDECHTV